MPLCSGRRETICTYHNPKRISNRPKAETSFYDIGLQKIIWNIKEQMNTEINFFKPGDMWWPSQSSS